jgi:hypothetical protein
MAETDGIRIYDLVDPRRPGQVRRELFDLLGMLHAPPSFRELERALGDVERLFSGEYPGYRASNTKYHDLEHTLSVLLAVARLLHGAHVSGERYASRSVEMLVLASLFHDVGLIQAEDDRDGTGAKYTIGHEERSEAFMRAYLEQTGYPRRDITDCAHMIGCTQLGRPLESIPFRSEEVATLGKFLASADLLAQMADRAYLEKLLLLFQEFQEGGVPGFATERELLEKTGDFYELMVKKRFENDLDNVNRFLRPHFRERHGLDVDLYQQSIDNNIAYLQNVLEENGHAYRQQLRRACVVDNLND